MKVNQKIFDLIKTLSSNGVAKSKVAKILECSPATVSQCIKHNTLEEYRASFASEVKSKTPKEYLDPSFEDVVLTRLDRIEKLLLDKKVIW